MPRPLPATLILVLCAAIALSADWVLQRLWPSLDAWPVPLTDGHGFLVLAMVAGLTLIAGAIALYRLDARNLSARR